MKLQNTRAPGARPLGVVIYQGPSRIDGKPIVVVATFHSENEKTGNMIQTWILRSRIPPILAIHTGQDVSICGSCPLRGFIVKGTKHGTTNRMRGCYVSVKNAPRAVYEAFKRGRYPHYDPAQHAQYFAGRMVRLGAYGDPVAAPLRIWKPLLRLAGGWTGYSHRWRESRFQRWRHVCNGQHAQSDRELRSAR